MRFIPEEQPCRENGWIDVTRPLENAMRVYPADPGFNRRLLFKRDESLWNMSVFSMSCHTGTHIDAPAHVGRPGTTDQIPPEALCGRVQLLDWETPRFDAVESPRLLLKLHGRGLSLDEARALVEKGVRFIGVEGLSVGAGETEWEIHDILLGAGVLILENAAIEDFADGWYEMRGLHLLMPGADGAPVRLLLRRA